ncbi:hypothetical protein M3P05_09390 [Sansalvadorimonas sp. 2012CJ34-2]|uniref:Transmembrane protein n=1 Tax=Parendozoicomonas callyspongiae TaxID=2942213 RepID=A0ABT0PGK0_9GAMM|nr:hypothetical protein [Sansalvadorimonas sp. 2012CJ34-2]MCL6270146.1 hypothetical protein [Sansalvadorimonas sp. 2012CJ34-2]
MIEKYLIAVGVIFMASAGWITVQHLYRSFANKNPQCGPFRDDGGNSMCKCCESKQYCVTRHA